MGFALGEPVAICARCGAEKDLALGRCSACAHLPTGDEREVAIVCSTRVLDVAALRAAQTRIRTGEPVRPTATLRARARAVLSGTEPRATRLTGGQLAALVVANLIGTPLLGYAVWWWYRADAGPAARQALLVTVPCSVALFGGIVAWRYALAAG